ncbi:MAG: YihY family inner membrane protein [Gammaproteobacteria bacterium]
MYKLIKNTWGWIQICCTSAFRLFREKYTYRASALAFTTLLAIVPLLSVIVAFAAFFPFFSRFVNLAQNYIFTNFVPTSTSAIQPYIENFVKHASHLPALGIVILVFTAVTLIITVEHTMNEIWGAPKRLKKISAFFLYWFILLATPLLIGFSVFISTYLFSLSWFAHAETKLPIHFLAFLPLIINTFMFSALYIIVPNHKVKTSDGFMGGFIAAFLFEVAKKGFAFYITQFKSYEVIYGALATIPIFLLWLYLSWLIILYGALVTNTKYLRTHKSLNKN